MYSIICNPDYWKELEQTVSTQDSQILHKAIGTDINIFDELEKISRLPTTYLILDLLSLDCDENKLIQSLIRYRINSDETQIIIIATGLLQGNSLLHKLVTMCSVYDIIDISEGDTILPRLLQVINKPTTYKIAVKWIINDYADNISNTNQLAKDDNKRKVEVKERTVTILKEKIVGTVTIAIAGVDNKIGTTHSVISIATFLKERGNNVAILEMGTKDDFTLIQNAYEGVGEKDNFTLNGIVFYKANNNILEILNEDFNYLLLDMGTYENMNYEEFLRSNAKIIVSGVKDWELPQLEMIIKKDSSINKYKYLFNFSDDYSFKNIVENMDSLKCYKNSYNPNPFTIKDIEIYNNLLDDVLIRNNGNSRKAKVPNLLLNAKKYLPFLGGD